MARILPGRRRESDALRCTPGPGLRVDSQRADPFSSQQQSEQRADDAHDHAVVRNEPGPCAVKVRIRLLAADPCVGRYRPVGRRREQDEICADETLEPEEDASIVWPAAISRTRFFGLTKTAPNPRKAAAPGPMPAIIWNAFGSEVSARLRQLCRPIVSSSTPSTSRAIATPPLVPPPTRPRRSACRAQCDGGSGQTIIDTTNARLFVARRLENTTRINSMIGAGLIATPIATGISEAIVSLMCWRAPTGTGGAVNAPYRPAAAAGRSAGWFSVRLRLKRSRGDGRAGRPPGGSYAVAGRLLHTASPPIHAGAWTAPPVTAVRDGKP